MFERQEKKKKVVNSLKLRVNTFTADEELSSVSSAIGHFFNVEQVDATHDVDDFIRQIVSTEDREEAFYVVDLAAIAQKHQEWLRLLPRITPFYAVKCNPDPAVIRLLASLDAGFDCASKTEICQVLECGVDPARIIFANPCKAAPQIRYAQSVNVLTTTFDNAAELIKIHKLSPDVDLVLRIFTEDSHSLVPLGSKFGASFEDCPGLLGLAQELGLRVVGVSFHVGSGCFSVDAFVSAVKAARAVFNVAEQLGMEPFGLLDLGGGFPGSNCGADGIAFGDIAAALRPIIDELFPPSVKVIAEPGRYYVCSAYTLAVNVFGRRRIVERAPDGMPALVPESPPTSAYYDGDLLAGRGEDASLKANVDVKDERALSDCTWPHHPRSPSTEDAFTFHYYINDGVYGSFKDRLLLNVEFKPRLVSKAEDDEAKRTFKSSLFGPTNDSLDCVAENVQLPELKVGDWLLFEEMGAYTISLASNFNGFHTPRNVYIWRR